MRTLIVFLMLVSLGSANSSAAEAPGGANFDGLWDVTLTCPAFRGDDDDADGYVSRFLAEIKNNLLLGAHGNEGHSGWHQLSGTIATDGSALLKLDGIVSNPKKAINDAPRGKPYSYRVRAKFEGDSGAGKRVGKRPCEFYFKRH